MQLSHSPKLKEAVGILITTLALQLVTPLSYGQEPPCVYPRMDQVSARVRARVIRSADGLRYLYLVENGHDAKQALVSFAVETLAATGASPMQISPSGWEAGGTIARTQFYVWETFARPRGLAPSSIVTGFGFENTGGLPAIVTFLAWGDVEPPSFPEGQAPESCEGDDVIENSFKGKTVGPRPLQQPFGSIEFLNYLITLVHDSRKHGWIKVEGVRQSLLAKLINAKRQLERRQTIAAKNMLNAFLQEVQATSCPEFTCPGNKPLTSEAHALLFFNGQFLLERLP